MIYVHPTLIWRMGLRELVDYTERLGLRLWNVRTRSGSSVIVMKPPQETRNAQEPERTEQGDL